MSELKLSLNKNQFTVIKMHTAFYMNYDVVNTLHVTKYTSFCFIDCHDAGSILQRNLYILHVV